MLLAIPMNLVIPARPICYALQPHNAIPIQTPDAQRPTRIRGAVFSKASGDTRDPASDGCFKRLDTSQIHKTDKTCRLPDKMIKSHQNHNLQMFQLPFDSHRRLIFCGISIPLEATIPNTTNFYILVTATNN